MLWTSVSRHIVRQAPSLMPCTLSQQLDLSETLCNDVASMMHLLGF